MILGTAMVFLDATVVNVALQRIGQDLPSGLFGVLEGESYVYNGYLLALSALLILAGALADSVGRRRMFLIGLAGFGVTSALCGLAPSLEALIVVRIAQGAAGALLVPGSLAILTATFEGEELGGAFGLWAGASAATSILGPLIGGVLVQTISWRAVFFMNVPLGLLAAWATIRFVPESRGGEAGVGLDWGGAAAAAVAVGGLSFGAIYGQEHQWADAVGPVAIGAGIVAAGVFLVLMARGRHPLVPLGLFRVRNFAVTNATTFLIYGAIYVIAYTQAIFTQGTLGYTAAAAGFLGLPGGLMLSLFSSRVGALGARLGPRRFMAVGPLIMAAGVLLLARVPAASAPWALRPDDPGSWLPNAGYIADFLPASLLFGIGLTILVAPLTTALMTSVPARRAGLASAVNNAISRVGPQLAGAVIFVAITTAFYGGIADRLPGTDSSSAAIRRLVSPLNEPLAGASPALAAAAHAASTDSFHLAMLIAAGLLLAGAALNAVGIRDPGPGAAARQGIEAESGAGARPGGGAPADPGAAAIAGSVPGA